MRKLVFTLFAASTMIFANTATDTEAAAPAASVNTDSSYSTDAVEQVSAGVATAKSGTFKTKYNSNIRLDGGTHNKILMTAKKGTTVTATHQKQVGPEVWYKVNVNGTSGWVLSTLLAPKGAASSHSAVATAKSGTFKTAYNSNIRSDAGTSNSILTVAKKGSKATATQQEKVGSQVWYKVNVNGTSGWILSTLLTSSNVKATNTASAPKSAATTKVSSSAASSSGVVSTAMSLLGTPYMYGGSTPAGFDCSGFVQYVLKQNGKNISRSTLTQFAETTTVSNPKVGDLVFFANTYRAGISHVGIYIGNNQFVHSGGAKAEVKSLSGPYWKDKFHSFKRY